MSKQNPSFSWGDLKVEQVTIADANNVKAVSNGLALSLLFNNADFNLSGPDSPQKFVWAASLSIPATIGGGPKSIYFHELFRGFVQKDKNARVLLVFELGGTVFYHDHQFGKETEKDLILDTVFKTKGLPRNAYSITLFVVIERRTPDSVALVAINSIDIEASFKKLTLGHAPQDSRKKARKEK